MAAMQWLKDQIQSDRSAADRDRDANVRRTWKVLAAWFLLTAAATVAFGATSPGWSQFISFASAGLLLAGASASVGALLGFLFGIPRSLQSDNHDAAPPVVTPTPPPVGTSMPAQGEGAPAPEPAATSTRQVALRVNTNLEQISDWLTKILVGVGLTNLSEIGPKLWGMAERAAPPLAGNPQVALFCMISFSIWGFFAAYLLTRLFLAAAFVLADDAAGSAAQQEQVAMRLTSQGQHVTAAQQYAAALQRPEDQVHPEQRRRLFEGLIYNYLYLPEPGGYTQAIQSARAYIAQPGNSPSGRIWAYLAAALGQKYADEKKAGATEETLARIEADALASATEAIKLDPAMKTILRSLWDPNDPLRIAHDDNDLEVFFNRDSFAKLLN